MLLVHLFVYFARVSLPLDVKGWLQLLIVVIPVFSITFFTFPERKMPSEILKTFIGFSTL